MSWKVQSAATYANAEDLTLMKNFLKVSETADDDLITFFIKSAARMIENYTQTYLLDQTWDFFLDAPRFNAYQEPWWNGTREVSRNILAGYREYIELDRRPVQSITSFVYFAPDDTETTFASASYRLDDATIPARIVLNDGYSWPTSNLRDFDSYRIRCVLGYGADQDSLPEDIRNAIRSQVFYLYENRSSGELKLSEAVKDMLGPYIIWK